ncbi:hypothetical protein AGMMS50289_00610 [Betaproteobacteria bacterium]|nr:hypothetical protein AGMMS50289_00610 [Betaproteobacteria bacterium]
MRFEEACESWSRGRLTEAEWKCLAPCLVKPLPKDFPPWQTVYGCFRRWRLEGRWARAMNALREAARQKAGKHREPSVAIIDSSSIKSTGKGGSAVMTQARKARVESSISR